MTEIPIEPIKKIMKDVSVLNISDDAYITLLEFLEKETKEIAEEAIITAEFAEREYVNMSDIKLAMDVYTLEIPTKPIKKIIEETSASKVSDDVYVVVAELLEKVAKDIATDAVRFARYAGHETVNTDDIKLALQ